MSDASGWTVVPAHREFPITPQFVPVEVCHARFALARLGAILSAGGAFYSTFSRSRIWRRYSNPGTPVLLA
jgi:hypothetical protein